MGDRILHLADGFWNVRGSFRILGVLNIGNQTSLAQLQSGRFVLLDSYPLSGAVDDHIMGLTNGGKDIEAILHLHPFHTVHSEALARRFPDAKLYGTTRHLERFPALSWQPEVTESEAFAALYADDFDFMVPAGVDFIPDDERLHFASVLAFHKASRALHVDDTLNWLPIPFFGRLSFHPTLKAVLQRRPGAAAEFRAWAESLADRCETVQHVCTAHAKMAQVSDDPAGGIAKRVREALAKVESVLKAHEDKHG